MTNLRRLFVITLALVLAVCAFGQTTTPAPAPAPAASPALPTYVGAGAAFNQIGTPKVNIWATAIYPVASSAGVYSSTTTDIIPVQKVNADGTKYYAFSTSVRQGVHKTVYTSSKVTLLLGGDAGVGVSQAAPTGVNVSLSAAFTATAIYQISPKWAVVVPIRGMYVNSAWNLIPEIGVLFKP